MISPKVGPPGAPTVPLAPPAALTPIVPPASPAVVVPLAPDSSRVETSQRPASEGESLHQAVQKVSQAEIKQALATAMQDPEIMRKNHRH